MRIGLMLVAAIVAVSSFGQGLLPWRSLGGARLARSSDSAEEFKEKYPEGTNEFGLFCKIGHGIPCPICCMKQHSPSTTGCKHANDRPLWAFDGPGAVFTCSQPCAARFGSTRCEQAA